MPTTTDLDEYLAEIRRQVCANCVERPPGGPPCGLLGKLCGVEQHLPELIDAIHESLDASMVPYFETKQRQVCNQCSDRHSKMCPCPMDYLLVLIVEAVETVDARHQRRHAATPHHPQEGGVDQAKLHLIWRLYKEATGAWTGCDWPTRFGASGLDLNGWTAARARKKATEVKGTDQESAWRAAADWLGRVEEHAGFAEQYAARAVKVAATGAWSEALEYARRARAREFATGRMVWRGFPMTWHRFFLALAAATDDQQTAPVDLAEKP